MNEYTTIVTRDAVRLYRGQRVCRNGRTGTAVTGGGNYSVVVRYDDDPDGLYAFYGDRANVLEPILTADMGEDDEYAI